MRRFSAFLDSADADNVSFVDDHHLVVGDRVRVVQEGWYFLTGHNLNLPASFGFISGVQNDLNVDPLVGHLDKGCRDWRTRKAVCLYVDGLDCLLNLLDQHFRAVALRREAN